MNPLCSPEDIMSGRRVVLAYAQGFGAKALPIDPEPLGLKLLDVWLSHGDEEAECCYGIVTESLADQRRWLSVRGTQDGEEWVEDAEFWPRPISWGPKGAKIEHGFGLIVENGRTLSGTALEDYKLAGVDGHSLGGAVAEGMAAKLAVGYAGLWAAPRLGNQAFRDWLVARVARIFRPYNAGDIVPDVPLDLKPFFEYVHPPGFPVDSTRAKPTRGCRHALLSYLSALDPSFSPEADCLATA